MKKRIVAILMVLAVLISLCACNLVEKNEEKDLARTAITVTDNMIRIGSDGNYIVGDYDYYENITKQEVYNTLNSYTVYYYVQNGYKFEDIAESFVLSLVSNSVVVQLAVDTLYNAKKSDLGDDLSGSAILWKYLRGVESKSAFEAGGSKVDYKKASENLIALLKDYEAEADGKDADYVNRLYNTALNSVYSTIGNALSTIVTTVKEEYYITAESEKDEDDKDDGSARAKRTVVEEEDVPVKIDMPETFFSSIPDGDNAEDYIEFVKDNLYIKADEKYFNKEDGAQITAEKYAGLDEAGKTAYVSLQSLTKIAVSRYKTNLKGNSYDTAEAYFDYLLYTQLRNNIVQSYQDMLNDDLKVGLEALKSRYEKLKANDVQNFAMDIANYQTALNNVSDTSFVFYSPANGYGYVKSLLVPFDSATTAFLSVFANANRDEKNAIRESQSAYIKAYDLTDFSETKAVLVTRPAAEEGGEDTTLYRTYVGDTVWSAIKELSDGKFTDDDENEYTLQKGDVITIKYYDADDEDADDEVITVGDDTAVAIKSAIDYLTKYYLKISETVDEELGIDELDAEFGWLYNNLFDADEDGVYEEASFADFYAMVREYFDCGDVIKLSDMTNTKWGKYTEESKPTFNNFVDKFIDWLFRFNTDSGMLNNKVDYLATPEVKVGEREINQFVVEFAETAREAVAGGVGAMKAVLTDYGWHIIVCTETLEVGSTQGIDEALYEKIVSGDTITYEEQQTVTYRLYQLMLTERQSVLYSDKVYDVVYGHYLNDDETATEDNVKFYKYRYEDLLTDSPW